MKYRILFLIVLSYSSVAGQKLSQHWSSKLDEAVAQFKACENTTEAGVHSCNKFIGQTLKLLYQLDDFYTKPAGRYMLAGEVYDFLQKSQRWRHLGKGYQQEALAEAQQQANGKKAVVAIYRDASGEGHLAYILPGELQASGSWRMQVPNSAAFFIEQPDRSYSNKGLSYSFPRNLIQSVDLYVRN